jgi:UDP-N-acetylmuramate--alanine ligase
MRVNGKDIHKIYAIGIGGIGMSAIARYCQSRDVSVSGYDRTPTALTTKLEEEGIQIWYDEQVERAPKDVDLVMYTPAIPQDHLELQYYLSHGYTVVKRSDMLQWISEETFNICVAGTHGKTTISTMIAHLLRDTGYGCNAFLGGISANYHTNFWSHERPCAVIEADEFDRSFLKLSPDIAIISATDPDHLDIYGTAEAVQDAFVAFADRLKPGGRLFTKKGLDIENRVQAKQQVTYHSTATDADLYAKHIEVRDGATNFDVMIAGQLYTGFELHMGGLHNVENMIAAIGVAHHLGIDMELVRKSVASFQGVYRRFSKVYETARLVVIDDYAHHPEELHALIQGAKQQYPQHAISILFQPHLYSRTQDQAAGFSRVLQEADEVLILPIYPAREKPIPGVNSEIIVSGMVHTNAQVLDKEAFLAWVPRLLKRDEPTVLLMAGAGDIDQLVGKVKDIFIQANQL